MVEVTSEEEGNLMQEFIVKNIEGIHLLSWFEIFFAGVLPLCSTLFVHGQHFRIFVLWVRKWCRGELDAPETETKTEQENIELHPKEEIEREILNDPRLESPGYPSPMSVKGSELTLLDHWDDAVVVKRKKPSQ